MPQETITDEQVDETVFVSSGINPATGDLDFGGNLVHNLAPGVSPTDAANVSQLGGGGVSLAITAENKDVATLLPGMVAAAHPSGVGFLLASAAAGGGNGIGLAQSAIAPTFSGPVQVDGLMTLADWTDATGSPTLSPLGVYFLDPVNPGMMTLTPPTVAGQTNQVIGEAVAPNTLAIAIEEPILL